MIVNIFGVGNMGGAMALNLLARGHLVQVHDIDFQKVQNLCEKGAVALKIIDQTAIQKIAQCGSPSTAEVTIISVVDAQQTELVLFGQDGVTSWARPGHTVLLCPTISPEDVERFAARLDEHGLQCIDSPMSGGPARAADGSMSLMVACRDEVFVQHEKLLRDLSSKLFRISEKPGDGARTKLVNNLLAAINLAGAAECMALAQLIGLDLNKTLDVIEQSSGQSWIGSDRMRRAIAGDFAPRAHMRLLAKDSKLALDMAEAAEAAPQVGWAAALRFSQALEAGYADWDDAALIKLMQS